VGKGEDGQGDEQVEGLGSRVEGQEDAAIAKCKMINDK
jgi:hypothetical protein